MEETERLLKELTEKDAGRGGSGGVSANAAKNEIRTNSGEREAVSPESCAKQSAPETTIDKVALPPEDAEKLRFEDVLRQAMAAGPQ